MRKRWLALGGGVLSVLTLAIGMAAEPVFVLSLRAAEQLVDRTEYLRVVLGGSP